MINPKLLWGGILLGIDLIWKPNLSLLTFVLAAIALDFITGVAKAKVRKVARTSEGYRKTIVKFLQYFVAIIVCYGAQRVIPEKADLFVTASKYIMMFVIYIEISSIFENLYEIDQKTPFSRYFIKPVLTILKFGLDKNPVQEIANKVSGEDPKPPVT